MFTELKKYRQFRVGEVGLICEECGEVTRFLALRNLDDTVHSVCPTCRGRVIEALPYPIKFESNKNLKNHLGMGNQYFPKHPSGKFFDGLSGHPGRKERVDFNSHEVFMTRERYQREIRQ